MSEEKNDTNPTEMNGAVGLNEYDKKIEELTALAEKYKNDFLYLRAEFENYKKNVLKERSDLLKYGSEKLAVELLNVVDNFERAIENKPTAESLDTYVKGVQMTANGLKEALHKFGIQEINSVGKAFDPMIHEALSSEPTNDIPEGHISKVFRKPYKMHDRLIRPGQVVVATRVDK